MQSRCTHRANVAGLLLGALVAVAGSPSFGQGDASVPGPPPAPPLDGNKFPMPDDDTHAALRQQTDITGRLAVQAIQGTPDAAPIGAADVEIRLVHRGVLVDTVTARLDEHGVVVVEDLPIGLGVQPVVQIAYGGVTYQRAGEVMGPDLLEQKVDVVCYDVTGEEPAWSVRMRHVMVAAAEEGLHVQEVLVIENPARRTWLGTAAGSDRPVTTVFDLPGGSDGVALGAGFHDWCCTSFEQGRLVNHLPLMPGETELRFSYHVHAESGAAVLDVVAPAEVKHTMVMVGDDLDADEVRGLETTGSQNMGDTVVKTYMTGLQQRGDTASLRLAAFGVAPIAGGGVNASARLVAALGAGLIFFAAVVLIFWKSARGAASRGHGSGT